MFEFTNIANPRTRSSDRQSKGKAILSRVLRNLFAVVQIGLGTSGIYGGLSVLAPAYGEPVRAEETEIAWSTDYGIPGLELQFPDWTVRERVDSTVDGVLHLEQGDGQIRLSWFQISSSDLEALVGQAVHSLAEVDSVEPSTSEVCGTIGETRQVRRSEASAAVITVWAIEDDRAVFLYTERGQSADENMRLHQETLSHVDCVEFDPTEPVFPSFRLPAGFEDVSTPTELTFYRRQSSESYVFSRGTNFLDASQMTVENWSGLMSVVYPNLEFALPTLMSGSDLSGRPIYSASAVFEGDTFRTMATGWYCEDSDLHFVALHVGPESQPIEPVIEVLSSAECPS
jgi:hypothetical protein